ncbi:tudor domain-containing protein 7A isoform X3 [Cynoglossus semilaevis]|uniref:tudor domain-containing protein 7A isoform X3 n=1 Tax=Cynoglossus semilaevis TaxID=244447 RepID=UPI0007DC988A|nr:tropomodulin-1 isoform X3 [Cynoglossus semilaevis]
MSDTESVKKMLRSVLLSSKGGVSFNNLPSEYRSLCGESIPLKKLGYSKLEDFLKSIPSVVQLEHRNGELICLAGVSEETASIAQLVARQKSSKKAGRSQVVNCKMRSKPSNPYMQNMRPRSSLRQPSATQASSRPANRSWSYGVCSASGDYRQLDQKLSSIKPTEHRKPQTTGKHCVLPERKRNESAVAQKTQEKPSDRNSSSTQQSEPYDEEQVQSRMIQLLSRFCSGVWMSKIPELYSTTFNQKLNPQVEPSPNHNRADWLVYPPVPHKPLIVPRTGTRTPSPTSPVNSDISMSPPLTLREPLTSVPKTRVSPQSPLAKPTFIFQPQPVSDSSTSQLSPVSLRSPVSNLTLALQHPPTLTPAIKECKAPSHKPNPDISSLLKVTVTPTSNSSPVSQSSADTIPAEVRQKIKELLSKYSQGLWAHALPKLFVETYKMPFPDHILDNLSLLLNMCSVEYSITRGKKKTILYNKTDTEDANITESKEFKGQPLPSGIEILAPVLPPTLVRPSEQYPSVLVTDAKSSNTVTIRYVGENYSTAQEALEDTMRLFYTQCSRQHRVVSSLAVGQLVAVRGEDGEEIARGQVMEVMAFNKVKVYYVDYGFSLETSGGNLLELHQDFLSLPFQANNIQLAGLENFSSLPLVQPCLEKLAVGKILLIEIVQPCQQLELPVAVLYDTSGDDDVNINSICLKTLQDKTMDNPLVVNVTYQDVCVTNVCANGTIYCQLPCRGTARLGKLLEEAEVFYKSQITSESLVSRPFSGKFCLAQYKSQWSRAEITNMYNSRVMEILFIDLGISATVEVTDLREIPPPLLKDFIIIPPQAIKCQLVDLKVPEGDWSPEVVMWVKDAVLGCKDCRMKISKLEERNGEQLVYMYLFFGVDGKDLGESINHHVAQSDMWQKPSGQSILLPSSCTVDTDWSGLRVRQEKVTLSSFTQYPAVTALTQLCHGSMDNMKQILYLPPPLDLPQPDQNIDVFVPVACHPGHFVLQSWQDLHKLTVLLGEMILYYNRMITNTNTTMHIQKGDICAARIDKNWQRVQIKGVLSNGLVSVYDLDHGKHDLVRRHLLQPLLEEFRQLPFQAIPAQLAGVPQQHWSEEAAMLFRNHVERRALVAQVESVSSALEGKGEPWEIRLMVYLVDTMQEKDLWIHTLMADIDSELPFSSRVVIPRVVQGISQT